MPPKDEGQELELIHLEREGVVIKGETAGYLVRDHNGPFPEVFFGRGACNELFQIFPKEADVFLVALDHNPEALTLLVNGRGEGYVAVGEYGFQKDLVRVVLAEKISFDFSICLSAHDVLLFVYAASSFYFIRPGVKNNEKNTARRAAESFRRARYPRRSNGALGPESGEEGVGPFAAEAEAEAPGLVSCLGVSGIPAE